MNELLAKVAEMRMLQRLYFKNHERNTLLAAKAAEYEVDTMLEQLGYQTGKPVKKKAVATPPDPKLF